MITETVYRQRGNVISLELCERNSPANITGLTRVMLDIMKEFVIDSSFSPAGTFDWSTNGADGQLDLDLGEHPVIVNLKAGRYKTRVTVFDTTYPEGFVWDYFWLEVD
jgi:hypothetical protein